MEQPKRRRPRKRKDNQILTAKNIFRETTYLGFLPEDEFNQSSVGLAIKRLNFYLNKYILFEKKRETISKITTAMTYLPGIQNMNISLLAYIFAASIQYNFTSPVVFLEEDKIYLIPQVAAEYIDTLSTKGGKIPEKSSAEYKQVIAKMAINITKYIRNIKLMLI